MARKELFEIKAITTYFRNRFVYFHSGTGNFVIGHIVVPEAHTHRFTNDIEAD